MECVVSPGCQEQGKRSDYEPSGLPVTREGGTVAIAAELGHGEVAAGILIKGAVTVEMEKADSVDGTLSAPCEIKT